MRILIAENNESHCTILMDHLSTYGECHIVGQGQEAVNLVLEAYELGTPYDLVVLEADLTDLTGLQSLKRIRNWENQNLIAIHGQESRIIVIASPEDHDDLFASFRQGREWYMSRPITEEALLEAMATVGISAKAS